MVFLFCFLFLVELKVSLPNRTLESIGQLETWAKENGVEMNDVEIAKFDGYDFGMRASGNIAEGNVVVSVPKKLMITVDSIKGSPMGNELKIASVVSLVSYENICS